jgi:tetratricopeptide (TPR) repeat protein
MLADLGRVIIARSNGADAGSAAALYERVLEEHPEFWGVRDALAGLLISAGRIDEAIAEAQGALPRIPPTKWTATAHARTLLTLGRMQAMAGKPEEGLANLRRAAEVRPTDAVIRENLAVAILQIEGNLDGAIAQAYEALKLAPGNHNLRFQLGGLEMQRGRIDEAIAIFDELERLDPGVAARRQVIAGALREAGRDEAARRFDDPPAPAAK